MRVGLVGVGTIGSRMAGCLLDAGHELTLHDVRREATAGPCGRGARWADTPRAVAEATEVVLTSLPGPAEVEAVVLAPDRGLLAGLRPGRGYIDTTTNAPDAFARVAAACRAAGVEVLDAPVSGRPPEMTVMAGGDPATFTKYRPLLACMARHVFRVGGSGAGCVTKLASQYMAYANFVAAAEGLLMAAKAGVDVAVLGQVIPLTAGASRAFEVFPRAVFDGSFTAFGTLDALAKDLTLACALAGTLGTPAAMGEHTRDVMKRAQAQGWGDAGFPVAVRVLEREAGAELRAGQR